MADLPEPARVQDHLSILYSFPHSFGAPGIGWTAFNQVTELVAAGHSVHLVAASIARPVPGLASTTTTLSLGPARLPHRAIGRERAFALHDRIAAGRVRKARPDVVHVWPLAARRTLAAASALGIAGLREVPNTHTAHAYAVVAEELDLLGLELPSTLSHSFNAERLAEEEREFDAATAMLVPSEAVRATFLERGFAPERLLRHQYGYRADAESAASAPLRTAPRDHPFTAIYLSRGEPRKGLHYALRAWLASSASETGRLLVYGGFVPSYRETLETMLAHPSVELRGFTDDTRAAFAGADVMLLPTIEEGSALVTYEAQAAGCVPLVSTAAGAVLDHDVHGLLHSPRDVTTLTAQLDALSSDPETLARLSAAAAAHAPALTWAAANVALVAAYSDAIALRRGGRPSSEPADSTADREGTHAPAE